MFRILSISVLLLAAACQRCPDGQKQETVKCHNVEETYFTTVCYTKQFCTTTPHTRTRRECSYRCVPETK